MEQSYTVAGVEPPLEELLNDRIARLVMRRDGLALADVWRAVELARSRLAERTRQVAEESPEPTAELHPTAEV